jgi:phthiocerol/phenolphthiocerol synthesis type-I polyketide synthase E
VLEAGPGSVLTALGRQACGSGSLTRFIPMLPDGSASPAGELRSALTALAQCWISGHQVTWPWHGEPHDPGRVPVPGYPYQRRRHWIDPPADRAPHAAGEPTAVPAAASQGRQVGTATVTAEHAITNTALSTLAWSQCTDDDTPREPLAGHCLVVAPEDERENHLLVLALQRAGARPVIARPGTRYAAGASEFTVRPGHPGDYARVLAQMTRDGTPATLIVHATSLAEPPELVPSAIDKHLRATLGSLTALARHLAALPAASAPGLLIVTSRAADVSGAEQLSPVAASLVGFIRSLALEAPALGCRVLDVASPDLEILAEEICEWRAHAVVALRGSRRWQAGQVPFYPEPRQAHAVIRRRGVYLLTGGTGGIGMAIARGIAGTGMQPHLVLLSRTGRSAGAADDRLRAGIAELEMCGAQVTVLTCDVTSQRALHRALDTVTTTIGPVNGVLHLAGLPGDGLVRTRSMEQMTSVLAPKVQGTSLLGREFAQRPPLDFFACFSSRAAIDGLVGGADYAAANAFEDAYAITLRRTGIPALSINWPAWATVGLAASYGVRSWSTEVSPASCPIMDEHRLDGEAVLPGTGQLDLMLRGLRHIAGSAFPVKLTDIVYHQMLAGDRSRRLEVRLHPDGRVESWSWPSASLTAEPVLHAGAKLAAAPERRPGAGLAALRAALTKPLAEEEASLFSLGPRWDNIAGSWTRPGPDASEVLLELRLPAGYAAEASDYLAHPALLDSATTGFRRPEDGSHLPFCCSSFTFYEPVPAKLFAYLRRNPDGTGVIRADLDLFDINGRLLAQASGYTLRKVEAQLLKTTPGTVAPQAADGIATADGVMLTLSLLTARHPGQVLVEPGARPLTAARQRLAPGLATAPPGVTGEPGSTQPDQLSDAQEVEEQVRALWIDAIGDPDVTPDADFFAVGGNSLTAVTLIGGLREAFGVNLPISAIFDSPTIGSLAASIVTQLGHLGEA